MAILIMLDRQETAETWWRTFRANLGAAHPSEIKSLLPEFFGSEESATAEELDREATAEDGTKDIDRVDQTKIKWSVPASEAEREDLDRYLSAALSKTHTITASELEEGGKWM